MAILKQFLRLLELLEKVAEFVHFLTTEIGLTICFCLLCYVGLLLVQCDPPTASILASTIALTLHCTLHRPKF